MLVGLCVFVVVVMMVVGTVLAVLCAVALSWALGGGGGSSSVVNPFGGRSAIVEVSPWTLVALCILLLL